MKIALVAHDARKQELIEWVKFNRQELSKHTLYATGTTGKLIAEVELPDTDDDDSFAENNHLEVIRLLSGPLGGDQQIGAMIAEGKIDCLIFFCDNLITQGHQQDVGALSRLASLYNIAFATNRTTADMILTSPLWKDADYQPILPECINNYKNRKLQ
ncbi:MAG: methylglyoxal synthase [Paludibacteraceae bacterium]